ncbi:hypothetical protein PSTG_09742 [Puccinia striiformis f. sp. tritici PST-78]|uniref:Uncharacterized protein n=2 Tax=Puccinia striiformis TaxID=27350 RepID=A0A0L0VCT1_9BASI|nr:hypothetical protein PSTG_09742 [Puccinia striiformis f. sp. tritici PST-78]
MKCEREYRCCPPCPKRTRTCVASGGCADRTVGKFVKPAAGDPKNEIDDPSGVTGATCDDHTGCRPPAPEFPRSRTTIKWRSSILASNRDEFLNRASLPADWHSFGRIGPGLHSAPRSITHDVDSNDDDNADNDRTHAEILSGRDAIAGGTWLGINKRTGKFGFLTNVDAQVDRMARDKEEGVNNPTRDRPTPASRGLLIQEFLQGNEGPESYINKLKSSPISQNMNGYNLVIGQISKNENEKDQMSFFCNRDPKGTDTGWSIVDKHEGGDDPPECTLANAISNGIAHRVPIRPKVTLGVHLMEACLRKAGTSADSDRVAVLERELFNLLSQTDDSTEDLPSNILIRPYHRLPAPNAPASLETWYGTITQTIVLVSETTPTKITFVERDAFQIQPSDSSGNGLATPVWMADEQSRWRRFEFQLPS